MEWEIVKRERFAALVSECRGQLSQEKFAKEIDRTWTKGTIQKWESAESLPKYDRVLRFLRHIGWSVQELEHYLETGTRPESACKVDQLKQDIIAVNHAAKVSIYKWLGDLVVPSERLESC